ncbi:MAG: cell division protein FtsA [Bacteroidota bacterium]
MNNKVMVGLDIGNSKVCAVVGRLNEQEDLEIMGVGTAHIDQTVVRGLVRNVTKTVEAISKAINEASQISEVLIGEVITNISSQNISSHFASGTYILENDNQEIRHKDIDRLIENMKKGRSIAGNLILHVCPQEFKVDEMWKDVFNPAGMSGLKLEGDFLILSSPLTATDGIDKCFKDSPTKTEIKEKLLSSLASSISTLTEEEKQAGVALIDIGAGNTDIIIFQNNVVRHVSTLPIGGYDITRDIQQGCSILPDIAEKLKVKFGAAISNEVDANEVVTVPGIGIKSTKEIGVKNVALIMEERLKEIIALAWTEIKKSGFESKLNAGLVITGGCAQIPYILDLFSLITSNEVRIGHPNINLAKNDFEIGNDPAYATAIGLLWKGFKSYDARKDEIEKVKSKEKVVGVSTKGSLFDEPVEKNFWKKSVNFLKKKLRDDSEEMNDKFDQ